MWRTLRDRKRKWKTGTLTRFFFLCVFSYQFICSFLANRRILFRLQFKKFKMELAIACNVQIPTENLLKQGRETKKSWATSDSKLRDLTTYSCSHRFHCLFWIFTSCKTNTFRVLDQPNTMQTMFYTFHVRLHSRLASTDPKLQCTLMRVLLYGYHSSLLYSRVGSQNPLI